MKLLSFVAIIACLCGIMSCGEGPSGPPKDQPPGSQPVDTGLYTVSGKIRFNKPMAIPSDARVLLWWLVVSGSPDYVYIVGEGKVNMADSTFKVTFTKLPPDEALNQEGSYRLGVGIITLTTDRTITEGRYRTNDADSLIRNGFLGGAPDYAVIYTRGEPVSATWPALFDPGFNTGRGVRKPPQMDEFAPAAPGSVELIIDDISKLKWINWT
jgi:hypothetical protein